MEARIAELWAVLSWPLIAVWLGSAGMALFWVELIKHNARKAGYSLGPLVLIALDSGLAALFALFVGSRLFRWPLDQAADHAVGVAIALPLLCIFIFPKVQKLAPDTAESMGFDAVPTQYRIDDEDTTTPK